LCFSSLRLMEDSVTTSEIDSFEILPDEEISLPDSTIEGSSFIILNEDAEDDEEEKEEEKSVFQGIRPKWVRDESSSICTHCSSPFTFFRRRHHCRFCGGLFCNDCCHVQAAFPVWFGYETPQRVCEVCLPLLFNKRQEEREKTMEISIIRSNSGPDLVASGFHTSKEEILSLPLRFLHPLCKFAFWFSGMYEGGSFDRTYINAAACMNIPLFVGDPVKSIVKRSIPVPKKWPSYDDEEWETHSIHNLADNQLVKMPLYIFTPEGNEKSLPILVWYHGGGFCLGSAENMVYQTICRSLAKRANCIVVSVEYRLAPEYKFPTQVEDAYAALRWVHENAESFGGDPSNIAVGGDSAGGSLSAVVSILARDREFPVNLKHQLLVYPCITDPLTNDIESHVKYAEGPVLSRTVCEWFMNQVFDNVEEGLKHPFASPLHLESHHDLPPATIINALHDPLCDHGKLYADKLKEAGVPATRSVYCKSLHGFFGSNIGESKEAVAESATALKKAFNHN